MNKCGVDPRVKKTLVRTFDRKVKPTARKKAVHDVGSTKLAAPSNASQKENELSQPSLCSSELFANYLTEAENALHEPFSSKKLGNNKSEVYPKMKKSLNFHFNDRIYKNLVELNANFDELKTKKEKRPTSSTKKDLEPNIKDFYEAEIDVDLAPSIPVMRPKFKPVRPTEDGSLHRLVASFESL